MLRIDGAVDRGGKHDVASFLKPHECFGPGRIVGWKACSRNRDETTALAEPRQRCGDMAQRCVGHAAINVRHRPERWVHQNHARDDDGVEKVIDLRGVEPGNIHIRE